VKKLPRPPRLTKQEIKERLWQAIECAYVEDETNPKQLVEKFQVAERTLHRYLKEGNWKEKRAEFQKQKDGRIKRQERDRSETYHERNQLMASTLQARTYRLFLEEQERLQLKEGNEKRHVDTFEGLRERAAIVQAFAATGQAVGYGPPEPPPPPRTDFKVIIHGTNISSRKFDPELEPVDVSIEMEENDGTFVPNIGTGDPNVDE
jgi:hypothetical protein